MTADMKRFTLSALVGVSAYTIVEAETAQEAIKIARMRSVVLGGERHGNDPEESWIVEEADGDATEIAVSDEVKL